MTEMRQRVYARMDRIRNRYNDLLEKHEIAWELAFAALAVV